MMMDDYDGQIIFGEPRGPKVSWHLSYSWGKTPKKPHPGNLSRPRIEPGPATWQARMQLPIPQRWTDIRSISAIILTVVKGGWKDLKVDCFLRIRCFFFYFVYVFFIHCYLETLQHLGHIASRIFWVYTRRLCISIVMCSQCFNC